MKNFVGAVIARLCSLFLLREHRRVWSALQYFSIALVALALQVLSAQGGPGPVRARIYKINRSLATLHSELRRPTHEIIVRRVNEINTSLADLNSELRSPIYQRRHFQIEPNINNINNSWKILNSRLKSEPIDDINNSEVERDIKGIKEALASIDSEVARSTQEPIESDADGDSPSDHRSPHPSSLAKPDLIPIPELLGWYTWDGKNVTIKIKNDGNADAGSTLTKVDFEPSGTVMLLTPPLARGVSTGLTFDIPTRCFTPNCSFRIRVDYWNQVNESNEANNTVTGKCFLIPK